MHFSIRYNFYAQKVEKINIELNSVAYVLRLVVGITTTLFILQ